MCASEIQIYDYLSRSDFDSLKFEMGVEPFTTDTPCLGITDFQSS